MKESGSSPLIPPGYKQTEVGVIPEDWEVSQLGVCIETRPSYGINAAAVPYSDQLPVYIRITDISDDGRFSPAPRVSVRSESSGDYLLADGDIVLARTGASVGKSYRYNPDDGPLVYAGFLIRVKPDPKKLLSAFAAAYANTGSYWRWVRLMSMRSGQPGINGNEYAQLPLPIPPLPEQRAIAAALSDVDALLSGLDRLIAKKRDLKQAAMQQLLTGQTRLPGFHGEWEVKRLGEVGKCLRGVSYKGDSDLSTHDTPHTKRLLRSNNVANAVVVTDEVQFVNTARVSSHQILQQDDILICMANGSKALVGKAGIFAVSDGYEYTFGAFMGCFRTNSAAANPAFTFYLFLTARYREYINNLLAGSSINNLRPSSIESLEFPTPPLAEQTAIAAVLSDMDAELAALESRHAKTRDLKQAMMQELLTGRTRLV